MIELLTMTRREAKQAIEREALRLFFELDGLYLLLAGRRRHAVCVVLTCKGCNGPFAAVSVPPGARFCVWCAMNKRGRNDVVFSSDVDNLFRSADGAARQG